MKIVLFNVCLHASKIVQKYLVNEKSKEPIVALELRFLLNSCSVLVSNFWTLLYNLLDFFPVPDTNDIMSEFLK